MCYFCFDVLHPILFCTENQSIDTSCNKKSVICKIVSFSPTPEPVGYPLRLPASSGRIPASPVCVWHARTKNCTIAHNARTTLYYSSHTIWRHTTTGRHSRSAIANCLTFKMLRRGGRGAPYLHNMNTCTQPKFTISFSPSKSISVFSHVIIGEILNFRDSNKKHILSKFSLNGGWWSTLTMDRWLGRVSYGVDKLFF